MSSEKKIIHLQSSGIGSLLIPALPIYSTLKVEITEQENNETYMESLRD